MYFHFGVGHAAGGWRHGWCAMLLVKNSGMVKVEQWGQILHISSIADIEHTNCYCNHFEDDNSDLDG